MGKNAKSLLTSEKDGTSGLRPQHSTTAVTTCLTDFMLLLVGCGGVDLNCERYSLDPSGLRPQGAMLDAWKSTGHGGAAPLSVWEG